MTHFSYRKLFYWIVGGTVALIAALSMVLSFLDWNQYRQPLAELASSQMNMKVELAGDVSIVLFPRPSVSAEQVRLSPATEGFNQVVATADKIAVSFGFGNLLKGKFSLQSLLLDGLELTIVETEQGFWRVRGWPTSGDISGPTLELLRVKMANSRGTVIPYGMAPMKLEGVSLDFEGTLPGGPLNWQGELIVEGEKVEITGRVHDVRVRDEMSVRANFTVAESSISLSGRILPQGDLTGRVKFSGPELGRATAAFSRILHSELPKTPNLPFMLDVQFDREGGVSRLVSRELTVADTRGRLDLTLAKSGDKNNVTGNLTLGVVALDSWIAALPEDALDEKPKNSAIPLASDIKTAAWTGALDVTVEGIMVRDGLGQRIDAVFAFGEEGTHLKSLRALLPGATSVAFTGNMNTELGSGTLQLDVGKISDLADWLSLELPENIPAGRLTTAKLKAELSVAAGGWSFANIDALLDTTKIKGALSGSFDSIVPTQVQLVADSVNLDAYYPLESGGSSGAIETESAGKDVSLEFDISTDSLHWLKEGFSDVRIVGKLADGVLSFSHVKARQGKGKISFVGSVSLPKKDRKLDISVETTDWSIPLVRYFYPDLARALRAAKFSTVDGTLSLVGPMEELRLGLDSRAGVETLSLNGVVGVKAGKVSKLDLQGGFDHTDLAALVRSLDIADIRSLPVRASISISKEAAGTPITLKVSGDAAGGSLVANLTYNGRLQAFDVSYNHEHVGQLIQAIGVDPIGLDRSANLRSEIIFSGADFPEDWSLKIPSFKNGNIDMAADIQVSNNTQFSGSLNITGGDFKASGDGSKSDLSLAEYLRKMANYGGCMSVSVTNTKIGGQILNAQNAAIILGDGAARFSLGEGATLNGEAAAADINLILEGALPFEGTLKANKLDAGSLLRSEGIVGAAVVADTSVEATFTGQADSGDILKSLKASGSTAGKAGVLNFVSVSGITNEIHSAKSGRTFLGKIGSLLRSGSTAVDAINTRFSLDSGVMLVETAKASGNWGSLTLGGQVNFVDEYLTLRGALAITNPKDVPEIPVSYEGSFDSPTTRWSSRLFERFVLSMIERRLRSTLFKEQEKREAESGEVGNNPGLAVFQRAFGLLDALRKAQEAKRLEIEAAATNVVQ